jgi:hypothetical protein
VAVDYSRSFLGNSVRLYIAGADTLLELLARFRASGDLPPFEAPTAGEEAARYYTVPTEEVRGVSRVMTARIACACLHARVGVYVFVCVFVLSVEHAGNNPEEMEVLF